MPALWHTACQYAAHGQTSKILLESLMTFRVVITPQSVGWGFKYSLSPAAPHHKPYFQNLCVTQMPELVLAHFQTQTPNKAYKVQHSRRSAASADIGSSQLAIFASCQEKPSRLKGRWAKAWEALELRV